MRGFFTISGAILVVGTSITCVLYFSKPLRAWFDTWPERLRIPVLGFARFICMFTGIRGTSIHNAASLYILFAGFVVEVVVLWHFLLSKSQPVAAPNSGADAMNRSIIFLLLVPLFAHQFLIFRNFTLPHGDLSAPLEATVLEHESAQPVSTSPAWRAGVARGAFRVLRFVQGTVEFLIYLAFGIISGEAGYLYAVGSVNDSHSPVFEWVRDHVVQTTSLQEALESLFIAGALIVCLLVFAWDCLVACTMRFRMLGEKVRERYRGVIWWFFIVDLFSMGVWILIASFVFRWFPGFSDHNKFQMLFAIALLYFALNLVRLCIGIRRLGREESFEKSQALAI